MSISDYILAHITYYLCPPEPCSFPSDLQLLIG